MKHIILIIILLFCVGKLCFAQNDSFIIYISKTGKETTKDSAYLYEVITKKESLWHGKTYFIKTKKMQSEGDYTDSTCEIPTGGFNNYTEDGTLFSAAVYNNGNPLEITYYYKTGSKKSYIEYNNSNINVQKGWDETGKEIPNYIVLREARFKGGAQAWQKYLGKHLNSNVAVDAGAPAGDYKVEVEFLVSKEGYVTEVKATTVPPKCKPCAAEAVTVIMDGPNWEPAIQDNQPVVFRQRQSITFQVVENTKKGGKN